MSRVCCFELLSVRLSACLAVRLSGRPAVRLAFNCQLACAIWIHNRASFSLVFVLWPLCGAVRAVCTPNGWHLSPALALFLSISLSLCVCVCVCESEWAGLPLKQLNMNEGTSLKYVSPSVEKLWHIKLQRSKQIANTSTQCAPHPCQATPFCCTPPSSGNA